VYERHEWLLVPLGVRSRPSPQSEPDLLHGEAILPSRSGLPKRGSLPAVDLAAVSDSRDQHEVHIVVDGVHNPVVADADSIVVPPGELGGS
jgi:hypothetical protein